ncbi:uncharacterized protein HGUI_03387 [Hanseniaspora guilliermondii]|uniref:Polyadenylation factor subunit 2 n=1 Tax=Hanseniaspora guilliermondii TaxID=56406 RepID=A0A1L0B7X2_9ASCO|nr:uncharacterized protein HGUI_03387 [Hanseniaspora guilliermondii]
MSIDEQGKKPISKSVFKKPIINQSNNILYRHHFLKKLNITSFEYSKNVVDKTPYMQGKRKTILHGLMDEPSLVLSSDPSTCLSYQRSINTITRLHKYILTSSHAAQNPLYQGSSTVLNANMQISSIAFHPSTKRFVAATGTGELTYWNVKDTQMENITQGHECIIKKIIMSRNGMWMVSGDDEGILKIWQAGNLRLTKTIENTKEGLEKELLTMGNVRDMCFNWDDSKMVACGDDKLVKIYDFQNGTLEKVLKGHNWDVNSCDWHETMGLLISGSKDNMIKLWDPRSSKCVKTILSYRSSVNKVRFQKYTQDSTKNYKFYTLGKDSVLKTFDMRNLKTPTRSYRDTQFHTFEVDTNNGNRLACGLKNGGLQFYDTSDDLTTFYHEIPSAHNGTINNLAWSPRGNLLITNSTDRSMGVWTRGEVDNEQLYYKTNKNIIKEK